MCMPSAEWKRADKLTHSRWDILTSSHGFGMAGIRSDEAPAGRNTPYTCWIGCVVIKLKNCRPQLNQALTRRTDVLRARTFVTSAMSNANSNHRVCGMENLWTKLESKHFICEYWFSWWFLGLLNIMIWLSESTETSWVDLVLPNFD